MNRFSLYDYVELHGKTLDAEIPSGSRGTIVDCYPEYADYLVEFWDDEKDELIEFATVHDSELRLVRRYEPPILSQKRSPIGMSVQDA